MLLTQYQNTLFVVGGPNGSGKTTLARELLENQNATYISADDIAYELNPQNPHLARIQAGKEFFKRLYPVAKTRENIIVESTLSGKSLLPILTRLTNEYTYNIVIAFTYLDNEFACNERVSLRVKKGGHHVPFDDVQRRFGRSIANFWNIYRHHCNTWHLYYSSYDDLQEVARSGNDDIIVLNDAEFTIFKQIIKKYE